MKSKSKFIIILLLSILLSAQPGFSGNTGKIAGKVVDKQSGVPLAGVNIVIAGTTMGAAANITGQYFINNVPPGTYTLKCTMMGYGAVEMKNVQVIADLTTEINFELEPATIQGEVVTVVAERPLVEKDITAKMVVVQGVDIAEKMPVASLGDVLTLQAGFVEGESGELHLRGGRTGEIAFYIDGILVEDPLRGGFGTTIDVNMVQELSVLTGGFNAEYGEAMSGIVNITTKEGSNNYSGKIQFESPMINSSPYHKKDWVLDTDLVKGFSEEEKAEYRDAVRYYNSLDDTIDTIGTSRYEYVSVLDNPIGKKYVKVPILGRLNANFSGPLPGIKDLNFFISGIFNNENSYLPSGFNLERQVYGKLTYRISPTIKLSTDVQNTWRYYQNYSHSYKYIPSSHNDPSDTSNYTSLLEGRRSLNRTFTDKQTFSLTHTLNKSTFYTFNFQRLFRRGMENIPGVPVFYDGDTGALADTTVYKKLTYVFGSENDFWGGDARDWSREHSTTYNAKFDIISQVHSSHEIKAGFDIKKHEIFRHYIRDPWQGAFRHRLEFYDRNPWEVAAYLQDKMEYDFMILNIGLRIDYANANDTYWPDPGDVQQTASVTNPDSSTSKIFQFLPRKDVPDRLQISPRIGLAHPVTDRLIFHFAYGHFFQNPDYYDLFRNDRSELNLRESDAIIGNPGLKPQKTVAFEIGGKYQISNEIAIDFTGFYKDIRDLTATKFYNGQPYDYTIYVNEDYGRVNGFDITITKKYSNYIGGNLNYTFSVAKGSGSDPLAGYYYREEQAHLKPKREFPLDFDRTHDFSLNVDLRFPGDFGPVIMGIKPLSNFGINTLFQIASGLPYTPSYQGAISLETNSERKGWISTLDFRIDKIINIGKMDLVCYAKITNALDHINVQQVWSETGDPWSAGPTSSRTYDRQANPANVGPRRDFRLGCYVKF